jgi:hypothetical protein
MLVMEMHCHRHVNSQDVEKCILSSFHVTFLMEAWLDHILNWYHSIDLDTVYLLVYVLVPASESYCIAWGLSDGLVIFASISTARVLKFIVKSKQCKDKWLNILLFDCPLWWKSSGHDCRCLRYLYNCNAWHWAPLIQTWTPLLRCPLSEVIDIAWALLIAKIDDVMWL